MTGVQFKVWLLVTPCLPPLVGFACLIPLGGRKSLPSLKAGQVKLGKDGICTVCYLKSTVLSSAAPHIMVTMTERGILPWQQRWDSPC
jgi:hypothetical protein